MATEKLHPIELAHQFIGLNADDFRMFWSIVSMDWDQEDGDLEAQWFYCGQKMRPTGVAVISAMHSAVASGIKVALEKRHGK